MATVHYNAHQSSLVTDEAIIINKNDKGLHNRSLFLLLAFSICFPYSIPIRQQNIEMSLMVINEESN
ncbi:hypothetical protein VCRA2119O147_930016 [Vibrio crassostreae]|uniref:hypothetical protein n=1 Tax=Vibrio crassostreae TaxID=246167 RepID=UPI0005DE4FC1|nr:hypothetical protein [Vibrio crassostreae]CAK1716674.1 hypothetical protein VCRA2117O328_110020 [Vibrio crassostreae]CAK1843413.1 hypothetical protein VCRA2113O356_10167 [Vibrio crassostreae]CAK1847312.1 hypothetical protein VCRA2110O135_10170 [Vibrio crassostreae]CAK1850050.1 hypothetical protein VCRA2110O175_10213 [Vibrio crassostreae]CAK1853033.1 hypothetical protein VCRA2113O221_10207 [Vibrio crassostreae]